MPHPQRIYCMRALCAHRLGWEASYMYQNMCVTAVTPDLIIPPGGHAEICCVNSFADEYCGGGEIMASPRLNDLDIALNGASIRQEARDFYENMSPLDRKQFDGLKDFELGTSIEDAYMRSVLQAFAQNLPAVTQKKLAKMEEPQRVAELTKLHSEQCMAALNNQRNTYSGESEIARNIVSDITKNLVPQQQELFAAYSHELSRKSLFFIEENDSQNRDLLDDFVIGSGSWGYTVYTGRKLFTADEKTFVLLAAVAERQRQQGVADWHVVKGSIRSFLRQGGLAESGFYIDRFVTSISAMHGGSFTFEGKEFPTEKDNPKTKKKREKERARKTGYNLISNYDIDPVNGNYIVILDRVFIETYIKSFHLYSRINVQTFCRQAPTSAALHRFFAGHTPGPDGCIRMNLLTVVKNNNMLMDHPGADKWPDKTIKGAKKKLIKRALVRLVDDGTFGPRTGIVTRPKGEDDMVVIDTISEGMLKAQKALTTKTKKSKANS